MWIILRASQTSVAMNLLAEPDNPLLCRLIVSIFMEQQLNNAKLRFEDVTGLNLESIVSKRGTHFVDSSLWFLSSFSLV